MTTLFSALEVVGCSDLIEERSRPARGTVRHPPNDQRTDPERPGNRNRGQHHLPHQPLSDKQTGAPGRQKRVLRKNDGRGAQRSRRADGARRKKNLRIGMAPDTFLGASLQTARKLVDDGFIGEALNAVAMVVRGYHLDTRRSPISPLSLSRAGAFPLIWAAII